MGFIGDIVGSVVGGVLGGVAESNSVDKTNETNMKINENNLKFAANATKIRADDMRRAGINPLLAANPGAAAQAPQQVGAQSANMGSAVSSAASIGANLLTKREQTEVAKTQVAINTAQSAADVASKLQTIKQSEAQIEGIKAGARLADEQSTTQAASRALMATQGGMYSAQQAGQLLNNREKQLIVDHWGTPMGKAALEAKLNGSVGGKVGQGMALSGVLNNLMDKVVGQRESSASRASVPADMRPANAFERQRQRNLEKK